MLMQSVLKCKIGKNQLVDGSNNVLYLSAGVSDLQEVINHMQKVNKLQTIINSEMKTK